MEKFREKYQKLRKELNRKNIVVILYGESNLSKAKVSCVRNRLLLRKERKRRVLRWRV